MAGPLPPHGCRALLGGRGRRRLWAARRGYRHSRAPGHSVRRRAGMAATRHESYAARLFFANQLVILVSQWWAGLLTPEVAWLALGFAPPAVLGVALGMHLFTAVDHVPLPPLLFALLFGLGLT